MPSATEITITGKSPKASRLLARLERWNRKLNFYTRLFLLFFSNRVSVRYGLPNDKERAWAGT